MIDAAVKSLSQMFTPALRHVLLKAAGLALILIVLLGILMQRFLASWADTGAFRARCRSPGSGKRTGPDPCGSRAGRSATHLHGVRWFADSGHG